MIGRRTRTARLRTARTSVEGAATPLSGPFVCSKSIALTSTGRHRPCSATVLVFESCTKVGRGSLARRAPFPETVTGTTDRGSPQSSLLVAAFRHVRPGDPAPARRSHRRDEDRPGAAAGKCQPCHLACAYPATWGPLEIQARRHCRRIWTYLNSNDRPELALEPAVPSGNLRGGLRWLLRAV